MTPDTSDMNDNDDVITQLGAQLGAELRAALDVTPSASFDARVRARVAHESMGFSSWTIVAGTVAVGAAVLIFFVAGPSRDVPRTTIGAGAAVRHEPPTATALAPVPVIDSVEHRRAVASATMRRHDAVLAVARLEPAAEVILPADQARAFQRFVSGVAEGRVVFGPVIPDPKPEIDVPLPAPASPVIIPAIVIPPIARADSE